MSWPQTRRSPAVTAARLRDRTHNTSGSNLDSNHSTIGAFRARLADHAHERRIKSAMRAYLVVSHDPAARAAAWARYASLHGQRSAQQVMRMEAPFERRVRRAIKRTLMQAFFHGRIPAWLVTNLFIALRLREL